MKVIMRNSSLVFEKDNSFKRTYNSSFCNGRYFNTSATPSIDSVFDKSCLEGATRSAFVIPVYNGDKIEANGFITSSTDKYIVITDRNFVVKSIVEQSADEKIINISEDGFVIASALISSNPTIVVTSVVDIDFSLHTNYVLNTFINSTGTQQSTNGASIIRSIPVKANDKVYALTKGLNGNVTAIGFSGTEPTESTNYDIVSKPNTSNVVASNTVITNNGYIGTSSADSRNFAVVITEK